MNFRTNATVTSENDKECASNQYRLTMEYWDITIAPLDVQAIKEIWIYTQIVKPYT